MGSLAIINLEVPEKVHAYEKYQVNFDVAGLAPGLNQFDPVQIEIAATQKKAPEV